MNILESNSQISNSLDKLINIKEKIEQLILSFFKEKRDEGTRLYFEMRIDKMLVPFVNLFDLIQQTATDSKVLNKKVQVYISSNPSLLLDGLFQMLSKELPKQEKELKIIFNQISHFSILIREFTLLYGTSNDHRKEFGTYTYRDNMPRFEEKGNIIALNTLQFLALNESIGKKEDYERLADFYIRQTIFKDYRLSDGIQQEHAVRYKRIKNKIKWLDDLATQAIPLLGQLSKTNSNDIPSIEALRDYYQVPGRTTGDFEKINAIIEKSKNRPIGFELEFNSGSSKETLKELAIRYQKLLDWENLYTAPHENMYDPGSDGLLYHDASLPQRYDAQNNIIGCPFEYSAPPFTLNKDKDKYISFLNMIKEQEDTILYANSESHQHVYAKDINLEGMRRIVLRRAWHDQAILKAFHIPEKTHDLNRSSSALLTNISSHKTEEERLRNYIIFSGLVHSAENLTILKKRVSRGCKYNSLNVIPTNTIEFRGMQGTFDETFLKHYLQFNLFFVESAIQNSAIHFPPQALEKARTLRLEDQSPRLPVSPVTYNKEGFNPGEFLKPEQKQFLLDYDKHITAEFIRIGRKLPADSLNTGHHRMALNVTAKHEIVTQDESVYASSN